MLKYRLFLQQLLLKCPVSNSHTVNYAVGMNFPKMVPVFLCHETWYFALWFRNEEVFFFFSDICWGFCAKVTLNGQNTDQL